MFDIVISNVTTQQAQELFPNDYIVLLAPEEGAGDIIFVGNSDDRWRFIEKHEPPEGCFFHILRGVNLRELCPITE